MNYYVVYRGRHSGIYHTWEECENEIKGFSGSKYKKFTNKKEADYYLKYGILLDEDKNYNNSSPNSSDTKNLKTLYIYTDGSCINNGKVNAKGGIGIYYGDNIFNEIRKFYFTNRDKFINNKDNQKIYIDKMPLNIIHVGEVIRIFPEAKFIVSLRHPCDCVLSCFMQSFTLNNAMANFLNLEDTANLYNLVMKLWIQYTSTFSIKYHTVKYEDIVLNFEKTVKNIVSFLELPWSDNVFKFYETAEKRELISTPSYDQVNKPIYTKAIGRWKKYEKQLLKNLPVLEPWIKKFDY